MLEAKDSALVVGEGAKRLGQEAGHGLAADAPRVDEPGCPESAQVPRDERLAQADPFDQLGHAGLALREALDDPQPIHVRKGLVDDADRAQLVGLVDDGRNGRADVRWGRGLTGLRVRIWQSLGADWHRLDPFVSRSTGDRLSGRRINGGLYQYALIHQRCQPLAGSARRSVSGHAPA